MESNIDAAELIFGEGKEAEVTSDEEGFKGAWFTVTILKLPNKNSAEGKALVQYKNLLEDDNETPYTESVPLSHIRPLPPQPKDPGDQCFEVKDVVDAFYLDGWWTGSVSKVLDNPKRYIVTFDVEFSSSDLRPHWKWVDGKWVKSSKLQEVLVSLDCQKPVELSCNTTTKDAGTSVQLESSKKLEPCCVSAGKSEMSQSTASKEPGKSKHLKRSATEGDATSRKSKDGSSTNSLVRGSKVKDTDPPKVEGVREENFGLIIKIQRLLRFHVEDQQHPAADEMVEASTEVSEVQKMTNEAESSVSKELPIECMSETMTEEESWHFIEEEIDLLKEHDVSRSKKEDGAKTGIDRIEQPDVVSEIEQPKLVPRNSQSSSAGKDDAAGVLEEMFSEEQTATEAESSAISRLEQAAMEANVEAEEMVFSEGREAEVTSDEGGFRAWYTVTILKLPEQKNTKGKALVQYKNILEDDNETPLTENVPLSHIRPLPPQPKVPGDQCFEVKDVVDAFYLDGWWTGSVSKVFDNPKRYIVTFDVEFSSSNLRPHWKWVDGKWVESSKLQEINLQKEHDASGYKKEDGAKTGINRIEQPNVVLEIKQPKLVAGNSQSPSAGKDDAAGVLEEKLEEEQTATEEELSAISGLEQAEGTAVVSGTDCQRKIIKMAGESGRILHETEEESPLTCHKELQPGVQKSHSAVMDKKNPGKPCDLLILVLILVLFLIQILVSVRHSPHGFANQRNDTREKSLKMAVQSPSVGMASDNERQECQDLPFVKSLPMWKEVESMEIFQVMPQNPHFRPLVELKEILREGLAVGHMLNFASMMQRTSKLTVADPRNHFTSILDALPDFEILGFDVQAIRDRISDLLLMKDRYEHLQDHSKEVKLQVKQYSDELTEINEEVDANYKKMRELEEKQALLLSKKQTKASQITTLQVSSDVTTQDIQRLEVDFASLAGNPW